MRFSSKTERFYLGRVSRCGIGYSMDPAIRKFAASGGIVSQILITLLENGRIDGAVVSRLIVNNGIIAGESLIATTPKEILASRGSIYSSVQPLSRSRIEGFNGRLAVVGLPC